MPMLVLRKAFVRVETYFALGPLDCVRVGLYRLGIRLRIHPAQRVRADEVRGPFFPPKPPLPAIAPDLPEPASRFLPDWYRCALKSGQAPEWLPQQFSNELNRTAEASWWTIADFDRDRGDIKVVWERSRMAWTIWLAQLARGGDAEALRYLDDWMSSWVRANRPYVGPNWKCGQEASIRVLHVAVAALILDCHRAPAKGLLDFLRAHLARIKPTVNYAKAQRNNHAVSEGAALFIGGSWLDTVEGRSAAYGDQGRRMLEEAVCKLVATDGSFSQYSVNYHRMMLDTLCTVEVWRQRLGLGEFSASFYERAGAAARWLYAVTNKESGRAPNIGHNDGARVVPLSDVPYADYRPSVQLAMALFDSSLAYADCPAADGHIAWLGVPRPRRSARDPANNLFDDGGIAVLRTKSLAVFVKYPRYRFRPAQADALHVDLWVGDANVFRDAGTFSYAASIETMNYYQGTASHNTIQFDDRDQMPRLGRFLFGKWLQSESVSDIRHDGDERSFSVAYRDWCGSYHRRTVRLTDRRLVVLDDVLGFRKRAVLRWRLCPGNWTLTDTTVTSPVARIHISASMPILSCEIRSGKESRDYLQETDLPVLEIAVAEEGELVTTVDVL